MRANQADYPITMMCRLLGVSTSGYYAWKARGPSARDRGDAELTEKIRQFHQASKGIYGAPKIHADLAEDGIRVSRKRVARLMREAGLQGVTRRKFVRTTRRDEERRPAPDLVQRDFSATGPNQLWVADITYVPTWAGFVYLAVVLDVWSRRIVGWSMKPTLHTEVVLEALEMAIQQRRPDGVIHHSDQGCQYTSIAFGNRCEEAGIRPSMGSVGDCYDNALAESFFATLEVELLLREVFRTRRQAHLAVFEFLEAWYNRRRRHQSLGYLSPAPFEAEHAHQHPVGTLDQRFRGTVRLESSPDSSPLQTPGTEGGTESRSLSTEVG